ncbi:hypothetical protein ACFXAF_18555 [Kitasatospora sp. NPDC059463]|uniref:hypothetical protein n=1 Tax=unclassified Kitasatospora TaxID=2633591 RepID=UPI0036BBACFF
MRRNSGRLAVAALVTVLVLVGGGLWWWQRPSGSADVPASACWGLVTAGDLRTLMDNTGKASEEAPITPTDLSGLAAKADCKVSREPRESPPLVQIMVDQLDEASYRAALDHETERAGAGKNAVLDFGVGVDGWRQETFSLYLLLRCDNGRPARPGTIYREIYLWGTNFSVDPASLERTQLYVDIAHRTAREIVRQEGCPDVRIGERAPVVAG